MTKNHSISIIGPTASGKTSLAVALAKKIDGEIISIDSRQFYRKMDIGTGKDLMEYASVPYHLIDIADAGDKLNVSDFKRLFHEAYEDILRRKKTPILCGGTGNYLLSLLENSVYTEIPKNEILRKEMEEFSHEELKTKIGDYTLPKDYSPDLSTKKRCIRALESLKYLENYPLPISVYPNINTQIFGLNPSVEIRREKISKRLLQRLDEGLIEEVEKLRKVVSDDVLIYYGLEYKIITLYLKGDLSRLEAIEKLEFEIHRFSKRQMTFFRKIEKDGHPILWIDMQKSTEEKVDYILTNS